MMHSDANELAERLKGSLPQMTDQQVLDCAKRFDCFPRVPVERAIDRYLEGNSEYSMPKLLLAIRVEKEKTIDTGPRRTVSHIDTLRMDAASKFPHKAREIMDMAAEEIVMRVARGWWLESSQIVAGGVRASDWKYRGAAIVHRVQATLATECNCERQSAEQLAQACVDTEENYQRHLEQVATSQPIPSF